VHFTEKKRARFKRESVCERRRSYGFECSAPIVSVDQSPGDMGAMTKKQFTKRARAKFKKGWGGT